MKKFTSYLSLSLFLICMVFSVQQVKANRAAAADLSWTWVSDSTYQFTYRFFKDCSGSTPEPTTVRLCYFNTCSSTTGSVILGKASGTNGSVVAATCSGTPPATTCSSPAGTVPGYREWIYEGQVTLPSRCDAWHFVVSINQRNDASITNLSFGTDKNLFTEVTINNKDAAKISAPVFTQSPIAYLCAGVVQVLDYGAVDPDGDVLVYSLISPATAADNQTTCVFPPASSPISFATVTPALSLATNPFQTNNTFGLSSTNGKMVFTPAAASNQRPQLTMLVQKYRGTSLVATMTRDMQFVVSASCTTPPVSFSITSATKALLQGDTYFVCPYDTPRICFNITTPDPTVTINCTDNHTTLEPVAPTAGNSKVTYTNQNTDNVSGCFEWTPEYGDSNKHMLIIKSVICKPGGPSITRLDTIRLEVSQSSWAKIDDSLICRTDTTVIRGFGGTSFSWTGNVPSPGSTLEIGDPMNHTSVVRPSATTTYTLTTDYPDLCRRKERPDLNLNQVEVSVIVIDPKMDIGPDTVMCSYSQLQLDAHLINPQAGISYAWRWRSILDPGDTKWMSDTTIPNPLISFPTPLVSPIPDSLYYILDCIPTLNRCMVRDTVKIQILKGFYVLTGDSLQTLSTGLGHLGRQNGVSDTAICTGSSITIQGWGDQRYEYIWTPGTGVSTPNAYNPGTTTITPTASTSYTLTAHKTGCRDSSKLINIEIQPVPTADIGPDRTICLGDTINMYATIVPDPETYTHYTYNWSPGGALERDDTFFTYFTGYITQEITFTVKTPAGCSGTDKVTYVVQPRKFMTVSADTSICPGDSAFLHADGGPLLLSLAWSPLGRIDTPTSKDPIVTPINTTDYVVVGVDSNNCVDSAIVTVTVMPRAVIYLADSVILYPGDVYQMNPEGNCLYYSWFPGIGMDYPLTANPKVSPLTDVKYYVTGRTDAGCSTSDSISIFVNTESYLDVPNAFIPGRGENGYFKPVHSGTVSLISFKIFNRWGNKLFETTNINEGWDGTSGGQPQPMGVYVYTIEAQTPTGKKINKQGNVTLIR